MPRLRPIDEPGGAGGRGGHLPWIGVHTELLGVPLLTTSFLRPLGSASGQLGSYKEP